MSELKAGDPAPDFDTVDQNGEPVSLKGLRGKRVVIYFYPKDNTPGCTAQACALPRQLSADRGDERGGAGRQPGQRQVAPGLPAKYELPFPLLIDTDHKIAEAFGVWQEKSMYGRKYMGILRSHFVIDEQGKLVDVQYNVKSTESAAKAVAEPQLSERAAITNAASDRKRRTLAQIKVGDQAPDFETVDDQNKQGEAERSARQARGALLLPQGRHARLHAPGLRLPRQLQQRRGEERGRAGRQPGRRGVAPGVQERSSACRSRCWSTPTTRSPRRTASGASASGTATSSWASSAAPS